MPKPKPVKPARALGPTGPRTKLVNSPWLWNDRPAWDYIGQDRGTVIAPRDPRTFALRGRGIKWTVANQIWAVKQGFFVHREIEFERAVIVNIADKFHLPSGEPISYRKPVETMQEIERRLFRRIPGYEHLYRFIQQQDQHGFTGAWDMSIQCFSPRLQWYRQAIKRANGTTNMSHAQQINAIARKVLVKSINKSKPV